MRVSTIALAIAALGVSISGASAAPQVRAGLLQCQGGQNVGFVVGSVTSFQCVFQSEGRRPEPYIAPFAATASTWGSPTRQGWSGR